MIAGFAAMLGQQARDTVLLKTAQQTKYLPSPQPNQRTGITDAQPSGLHPGCVKTCDRSRRTLVESRHGVGGNVRMNRFVQCEERTQDTFLPSRLEDYVTDDNPVRVIDVFVAEFDLTKLGFEGMSPQATGRPDYHPSILLKIYLYGYLNRIQSSRRLERETQRNVEMMWLTGRLMPDFKTIANFRKDNGPAIRGVCRQFIVLCRQLDLFSQAVVAVDGSRFKAVNNRDRNYTSAKVQKRLEQLKEVEVLVQATPDKQIPLTDPDARSMATSGKGTGVVGYNVNTVVDAQHHPIVAHEVTNVGNDRGQLATMAQQAQTAMGRKDLEVVADRGYFKGEEILACQNTGVTPFVPKPLTSGSKAEGRFGWPAGRLPVDIREQLGRPSRDPLGLRPRLPGYPFGRRHPCVGLVLGSHALAGSRHLTSEATIIIGRGTTDHKPG